MKYFTLLLTYFSTITIIAQSSPSPTQYQAINNALNTLRGIRFHNEIGPAYTKYILQKASNSFTILDQNNQVVYDRKNVPLITLTIDNRITGIVKSINGRIYLNPHYLAKYRGSLRTEFEGIVYHEVARVRQWNGRGKAPRGLITGIADFFRLNAGYAAEHWVSPGQEKRWDEGYDVTARFLEYCEGRRAGFVSERNGMMKDGYRNGFFEVLRGVSVDELWEEYQVAYRGSVGGSTVGYLIREKVAIGFDVVRV